MDDCMDTTRLRHFPTSELSRLPALPSSLFWDDRILSASGPHSPVFFSQKPLWSLSPP